MNPSDSRIPEPLNLRLRRITPRWAQSRVARRRLVVVLYLTPLLWLALGFVWPLTLPWLALLGFGLPLVSLLWLMGATGSRADMPDLYLDERERGFRDRVYRLSFLALMGFIALGYSVFTLTKMLGFELPRVPLQALFSLLFLGGLPLPTVVQAWLEPDPLEEENA